MPWKELLAYWKSKHIEGSAPSRADLDPIAEIPRLVRNLILIDVLTDGYRYRLVGSEVASRIRETTTGQRVGRQLFGSPLDKKWLDSLDAVAKEKAPRLLQSQLDSGPGAVLLTVMLPLVSRDGRCEMILAGCFFDGVSEVPCSPRTLDAIDIVSGPDESRFSGSSSYLKRSALPVARA